MQEFQYLIPEESSDAIITLSTCYSDTVRTVVHAKLIKRSPKSY